MKNVTVFLMVQNKMIKLGDKIRLGIMYGFLTLVAYVWIEAIMLINMAYSD